MRGENRAEELLSRYVTSDPAELTTRCLLFAKDILNWQANGPHQIFWMDAALHDPFVLLYSVPRGGKTMCIEAVDIYEMATNAQEDLRIYAPKLDQCRETLKYHYDWIDASPILKAFLRRRNGKPIFSSENYEFINQSNAKCYTIRGELEGHNVSISRVEEFDDWPWERFTDDIVRRMGAASKNARGKRMRITGTIMGEENIHRLVHDPVLSKMFRDLSEHPQWGKIDVYLLLAFGGILDEAAIEFARSTMSRDEWARSGLLRFTEAKNFIWQRYIRAGQKLSNEWGLQAVPLERGGRYVKAAGEVVGIGLDCGHAGQRSDSSVFSLQVNAMLNTGARKYLRWLNGFNWPADVDAGKLEDDILDILDFYRPDGGYGDALKHDIIASINRKAYARGITSKNLDEYPENTPGNWEKWYIQPMWNTDKYKHEMYSALQHAVHNVYQFFPYFDPKDDRHEAVRCGSLIRQLQGIRQAKTGGSYPSYHAENAKIGDDDADAQAMCVRWLMVNLGSRPDFRQALLVGQRTFKL